MNATIFALLAPVAVSWQLLEIRGLSPQPVQLLLVAENAVRADHLRGEQAARFRTLATAVQEALKNGGTPSARLTADYLAATQEAPRVLVVRTWLRLGEEEPVRGVYLSDRSAGGQALVIVDPPTGDTVALVRWEGQRDAETERHVRTLLSSADEKARAEAEAALIRRAKGRRPCLRVAVHAGGRRELLPCNATHEDMAATLAALWVELASEARPRLGAMLRFIHGARFTPPADGALFPYFTMLRSMAVPPQVLGIAETPVSVRQLQPTDIRDFLRWSLPSGDVFRPFWGKPELPASDLSLSFPQLLRRAL